MQLRYCLAVLFILLSLVSHVYCLDVYHTETADGLLSEVHDPTPAHELYARRHNLNAIPHRTTQLTAPLRSTDSLFANKNLVAATVPHFHAMADDVPADEPDIVDDPNAAKPANCTNAATTCAALTACSGCVSDPCCGWCGTIINATVSLTTGTCYPVDVSPEGDFETPAACNADGKNPVSAFQLECGLIDTPNDNYNEDGSLDCTGVVCNAPSCGTCQLKSGCCGWCASTQTCFNFGGDEDNIPLGNSTCPDEEDVLLYGCDNCKNVNCSTITGCSACTDFACCGWCPSSSTCFAINATNPAKPVPLSGSCSVELDVIGTCEPPVAADNSEPFYASPGNSRNPEAANIHNPFITQSIQHTLTQLTYQTYPIKNNTFGLLADPIVDEMNTAISANGWLAITANGKNVGYRLNSNSFAFCYPGYTQSADKSDCEPDPTLAHLSPWMFDLIPACSGGRDPFRRDLCDAPEVLAGYAKAMANQITKMPIATLDYTVYVFTTDDGSAPSLSAQQLEDQLAELNAQFAPAFIQFRANVKRIASSAWKAKTPVPNQCTATAVADNNCDETCNIVATAQDGGACASSSLHKGEDCPASAIGNGVCDEICNFKARSYDGGDCCSATDLVASSRTCRDPTKPVAQRAFYTLQELVDEVGDNNEDSMNVWVLDAFGELTTGAGKTPIDSFSNVFSKAKGGARMYRPKFWGYHQDGMGTYRGRIAVRTFARMLGLRELSAGVGGLPCGDFCLEKREFTDVTTRYSKNVWVGDLASDTNPMPFYAQCNDCENCHNDGCPAGGTWAGTSTPFNNLMSYSEDTCRTAFSPQQLVRMRCVADSVYRGYWWKPVVAPPVVVPPVVLGMAPGPSPTQHGVGIVRGSTNYPAGVIIDWVPALAPTTNGVGNKATIIYRVYRNPPWSTVQPVDGAVFFETPYHNLTDFDIVDVSIQNVAFDYFVIPMYNGVSSFMTSPTIRVLITNNTYANFTVQNVHGTAPTSHILSEVLSSTSRPHIQAAACPSNSTTTVCSGRGTCSNGMCTCNAGYWGLNCASVCNCQNGGNCTSTGTCACPTGFKGTRCQSLSCPTGIGSVECSGPARGNCTNTGVCACGSGFGGNACQNTVATTCPSSRVNGTGALAVCGGVGTCKSYQGYFYCVCPLPYRGIACQRKCPTFNNVTCGGKGVCMEDGKCACIGAFKGPACSTQKIDTYQSSDCNARTNNVADSMVRLDFPLSTCRTRSLLVFSDVPGAVDFHKNYTLLSSPRQILPLKTPLTPPAKDRNSNTTKTTVSIMLGERSQTLFVNWSTVSILYSADGKNWTTLPNSTFDPVSTTVSAPINQTGMFVAVAKSSTKPFGPQVVIPSVPSSSSSSSSSSGGSNPTSSSSSGGSNPTSSSSTGVYIPGSAAVHTPHVLMTVALMMVATLFNMRQ